MISRYSQASPAISEGCGVLDFCEGRVKFAEFFADALDGRSNVCPISLSPLPGNEAFVVLKVVDRAVGLMATDVRRQKIDDVVFTDSKSDIDLVPKGSVYIRPEDELAAEDVLGSHRA